MGFETGADNLAAFSLGVLPEAIARFPEFEVFLFFVAFAAGAFPVAFRLLVGTPLLEASTTRTKPTKPVCVSEHNRY